MATAYAPPTTISDLKQYVQGKGAMQAAAESTVLMFITHNHLKAQFPEIRLDRHMSIAAVKRKINTMTGTSLCSMTLQLLDSARQLVAVMGDDDVLLGRYSPQDGWVIHVVDSDAGSLSAQGWLEDTSKVAKYVMSEADYEAREHTYRRYKAAQLAADPSWSLQKEMATRRGQPYLAPPVLGPDHQAEQAARLAVGQRCQVEPGERRGEIKFVGRVPGLAEGWWVGVCFDEPLGKHDGSVKGVRYFDARPGHGGFVRPAAVTAGDFPPIDDFSSDLGSDDEI